MFDFFKKILSLGKKKKKIQTISITVVEPVKNRPNEYTVNVVELSYPYNWVVGGSTNINLTMPKEKPKQTKKTRKRK